MMALMALGLGAAQWRMHTASNDAASHQQRLVNLALASDEARSAQVNFKIQIQEWKNTLLRGGDPAAFDKYSKAFREQGDKVQEHLENLQALSRQLGLPQDDIRDAQAAQKALLHAYLEQLAHYNSADADASAHKVDASVKGKDRAPTQALDGIVARILKTQKEEAQVAEASLASEARSGLQWSIVAMVTSLILGMLMARLVIRSITHHLDEALAWSREVADGQLRSHDNLEIPGDELGELLSAIKTMVSKLSKVVVEVRQCSDSLAHAAVDIEASNAHLSQRTESQASSLQQSTSTITTLSEDVQQNARHAQDAQTLAQTASAQAELGGGAVQQVVQTMQDIQQSASKIVDIIGVIDGIAFQTNILALNAAVEAARAGEQGRGFAVVAGEVRTLAQRSANAAREIKSLIQASESCVERGGLLVNEAGDTITKAVKAVEQVRAAIDSISATAGQQALGIREVSGIFSQFDAGMQQTAAQVEEAAAAALALRSQSQSLREAVAFFEA
jgi:methyl-accepting chemotaxis protein